MAIKTYSITLDDAIVEKAKEKAKGYGAKLSTVLNKLLENWVGDGWVA